MDSEAMEIDISSDDNSDQIMVEEKEPLFVEDRTDNFRMDQAIQYNPIFDNQKNLAKSNFGHRQNACWNCCSTDHSLQNCPQPRNPRMIAENRQEFHFQKQMQQSKFKMGGRKNVRYFVDETDDLCSRFTPGKLSNNLLQALNVPKNGIPLHIYKMREHGYPSGWLEEAREEFSGISIFTAPNQCLPLPGKERESVFYCKLNEKKLHEYPGFNAPCPPDTIDEYETIGCPQYNPDQNLKLMYNRLKTNNFDTESRELTGCDSVVNVAVPQTFLNVEDEVPEDVSKNSVPDDKVDNLSDKAEDSSLEDGEITEDKNVEPLSNEVNDSEPIQLVDKLENVEECIDTEESMNDKTACTSITSESSNSKRNFGDVKSEVLGTPIIKHCSPYRNRPAHDQFAKGMVDMVDHENLPNAVGTFQKLKKILLDVRKTMNDFCNEYV